MCIRDRYTSLPLTFPSGSFCISSGASPGLPGIRHVSPCLSLIHILSSAECCEYGASSDQQSFLRTIGEEGKRMSHLIDEMLYLSQSRDQQMRIHLEQVELDTLCLKVFESFEPLAARQGLTLSLDLPERCV